MKFKLIAPDGPEYEAEKLLRWEVLAKPLGRPPETAEFPEERESLHLIALEGKRIVGCICFHPETNTQGRIFEIAVSDEYQGRGFGRKLIHAMEKMLQQKGILNVYLFARAETEDFYFRLGYHPEGEVIEKMGMKQRIMKKTLDGNT